MYKIIIILLFLFPSLLKAQFDDDILPKNDLNVLNIYFNSINLNDYNHKINIIDSIYKYLDQDKSYLYSKIYNIHIKDSLNFNELNHNFELIHHPFIKKKIIINEYDIRYLFKDDSPLSLSNIFINDEIYNDSLILIIVDNELYNIVNKFKYNIYNHNFEMYKNNIIQKIIPNINQKDLIFYIKKYSINKNKDD